MPDTTFLDVSHHNGIINWPLVAQSGIKGVAIKATNGAFQTDSQFIHNAAQAKANGLHFGPYHFLLSDADPDAQADNFLNHIAHTGYDLLPTVDVEWDVRRAGEKDRWLSVKKDVRAVMVGRFIKRVKDTLGVLPIIYTATSFWNPMIGVSGWEGINFADCPLWIAQYTKVLGKLPVGWKGHAIWQFSGSGKWAGFTTAVDLDQLNVSIESLVR